MSLPSWEIARAEDWLGKWAMNLMLLNVSTRRFGRAVRLPEGDVPAKLGRQPVQVGRLAPVRRVVGRTDGRLDVVGSVAA